MESKKEFVYQPNTKPHIINRIIAALIDACIVLVCFFGVYSVLIKTPLSNDMMNYQDEMVVIEDSLLYSTGLGVKEYEFENDETLSEKRVYVDENNEQYVIVTIKSPSENATQEEKNEFLNKELEFNNQLATSAAYANAKLFYILNNYGIICLTAFAIEGVFYLMIPLIDKKRRTIGKMLSRLELIDSKTLGTPKYYQVIGSFSWKLIVESLIPFVFLNQATFIGTMLIQFIVVIINKDNGALHDLVSRTKVVISEIQKK